MLQNFKMLLKTSLLLLLFLKIKFNNCYYKGTFSANILHFGMGKKHLFTQLPVMQFNL